MSTIIAKNIGSFNTQSTKLDVVAIQMNTNKSTVSKFQNKRVGDASVNKLKRYIEAIGGKVAIEITLPDGNVIVM